MRYDYVDYLKEMNDKCQFFHSQPWLEALCCPAPQRFKGQGHLTSRFIFANMICQELFERISSTLSTNVDLDLTIISFDVCDQRSNFKVAVIQEFIHE